MLAWQHVLQRQHIIAVLPFLRSGWHNRVIEAYRVKHVPLRGTPDSSQKTVARIKVPFFKRTCAGAARAACDVSVPPPRMQTRTRCPFFSCFISVTAATHILTCFFARGGAPPTLCPRKTWGRPPHPPTITITLAQFYNKSAKPRVVDFCLMGC